MKSTVAIPKYITPAELRELLSVSESTVKRLIKNEGLPKPLRVSGKKNGHRRWVLDEVVEWMNVRKSGP